MSVFLASRSLSIPHQRRIDKLVCAMHQDRARVLAHCANRGVEVGEIKPVCVQIRGQAKSLWARILERAGFQPRMW